MLKRHYKHCHELCGDHALYLTLKILFWVEWSMPKWNIASLVTSKQSSEKPNRCYLVRRPCTQRHAEQSPPGPVQLELSEEIEETSCYFGKSQSRVGESNHRFAADSGAVNIGSRLLKCIQRQGGFKRNHRAMQICWARNCSFKSGENY